MSTQPFPVSRPDPRLLWLPPGLSLLAAIVAVAVLGMREPRAWAVTPILIASVVMLALILRRREVRLGGGTLTIAAGLNTRRVAVADLDLAAARIVSLAERTELKPMIKVFGTRLPGLSMGHFRLRDRGRAFVLLTGPSRVLVLPERSGRRLLLSLEQPQALLDALRSATSH